MAKHGKRKRQKKSKRAAKTAAQQAAHAKKKAAKQELTSLIPKKESLSSVRVTPEERKLVSETPKDTRWWKDLSAEAKIGALGLVVASFFGVATLAAAFFVPEVRCLLKLEKCIEAPPPTIAPQPPPGSDKKEEPEVVPKFRLIPMPMKGLSKKPVLRAQNEDRENLSGDKAQGMSTKTEHGASEYTAIDQATGTSDKIDELSRSTHDLLSEDFVSPEESTRLLEHRVGYTVAAFNGKLEPWKLILGIMVDANGNVQEVQRISGPEEYAALAEHVIKQWKYKPYVRNGKAVAPWKTTVEIRYPPEDPTSKRP